MSEFTHFDAAGNALMVDVSDKADTARVAVAQGKICVSREIYEKIAAGSNFFIYFSWYIVEDS